jgi:hypothetical protein
VVSATGTDYHPVKFLDRLEGNRHIVMLYDDDRNADLMIARYFQKGLDGGQSCVFFTDHDPKTIERRLSAAGLDVERWKRQSRLRVFPIEASDSSKTDVMATLKAIRAESTKGMEGPFRFVGRTIIDIETIPGMTQGMALEKIGQEHFEEFDNSQLCYYDVRKLERSRREEWVRGLLKSHHQAIYASDPDKAVGFETSLLEEDE